MSSKRTLLRAGEPAWARLDREKRAALRRAPDTPIEELLRAGQRLSAQAAALRRAVSGGRTPARS
jgi:hypothetical protein